SLKNSSLQNITKEINLLPIWLKEPISTKIKLSHYQSELNRLSKERDSALNEQDFIDIAGDLYNLSIPQEILINSVTGSKLFSKESDIDPEIIENVGIGSVNNLHNEY